MLYTNCTNDIMDQIPLTKIHKYSVQYKGNNGFIHNVELYAFSEEQARQEVIELVPYVFDNPNCITGITTHSK